MKRLSILLVSLLMALVVILTVYAEGLTRDELISQYGLEDSEYLDEFIAEYDITEDYAEMVNIQQVFRNFLFRKYSQEGDYTELLQATRNSGENEIKADNISRILWFWNPEGMIEVRLFDLEEMKLYYGDRNFLPNIRKANVRSFEQGEMNELTEQLKNFGVADWQNHYLSSVDNSTGFLFWELVIEFKDGTYFVSSGSGTTADNLPDTYSQVKDLLQIT